MSKLIISIILISFFLLVACGDQHSVIVELTPELIKVNGKDTASLSDIIQSIESCERVQIFVTPDTEHQKVADVIDTINNANCKNIAIQAVDNT